MRYWVMQKTQTSATNRRLRGLIVSTNDAGNAPLAAWLRDQGGFNVTGPAMTLPQALALSASLKPNVVLLDVHALPIYTGYIVKLFKQLSPAPTLYVLTHDDSDVMKRRCATLGADGVFHKTAELEALRDRLGDLAAALPGPDNAASAPSPVANLTNSR